MAAPTAMRNSVNGSAGKTNGYFSPPSSPSSPIRYKPSISGVNKQFRQSLGGGANKTTIVRDTAISLKRKSASDLGAGISETADKVGYLDLVEWIRSERLSTLPHKGSKWDTVLIRALFFAERLHGFETALKGHALDLEPAAQLGYGHTRLLLELGHENSEALDKAFGFLYRCSASVAGLLIRAQVLRLSSDIYEQLCMMYSDLLTLVIDVAIRFYKASHSGHSDSTASLDLFAVFGDTIATFRERKENITKAIWDGAIQADNSDVDEAIETSVLARWLAPQDRVLATLELDHTLVADQMVEMTCVWFHDELAKFVKSSDHSLLINGPNGSGKTTLACALAERLQRPVAKKSYATVFYSVGAVPSVANTLNVVKAILHQLLAIRVGNMYTYHAIAQAYDKARFTADATQYEELLWHALQDVLQHPLQNGQDTVIIIEGLDELLGGASAGQGLLQRLVNITGHGKGVKFIGLAQNLTLPTGAHGIQRNISWHNDTKDDLHEVSIKKLARIQHFRTKTGREQENIISHIIEQSQGSFLWLSLTCDLLRTESSADSFNKAVNAVNSKTTIDELTQRILTVLQPSDDAKLLLSWLVNAARPLTYKEIEALFSVNGQSGTRAERRVDVHHIVQSLLPLLGLEEDIVRIKHSLVQRAVVDLLKKGSFTLSSVKDTQQDLLLRLLTYAKVTIREKGEPTLDSDDRSPVDHYFSHHVLLEYVIRYYTWHLGQISIAIPGKPVTVTPELQKVFPDSTVMSVLEWLCWDDQFPGAQEVEYHELVQNIRIKVFTQKHPSVLQSYINTACYYEMMQDTTKAGHLYYLIATIGRDVLSVLHPVVVECSLRFLRITSSSVTTSRTEIMTYREHILILLITAYERQYGVTSEIVVKTREQLVELYMAIGEQEKAQEILIILQGNTGTQGKLSQGTRDIEESLRVSFGRRKERETGGSYDHNIFEEEEEEEETLRVLDLKEVDVILRQIETFISKKELVQAEELYVQLWQRLSVSCRSTLAVEWHARKIDVVQQYARFLETHQRRSEATSLLISIWREYEHHEVAFSELIVNKLTETARFLKTVGEYSAALSIFKHASSYYRNVRKEESSRSLTEIEEEMTVVSSQAFAHSSKEISKSSETAQWDMFHVLISNHHKSVDQSTLTLAKSLTSQYIERREWSKAISVVETTLKRTWSSFMAKSVHEVTLTSSFQKESVELVEQLAQCYIAQRSFEKAEDVYVRLFRASLTSTKDQTLLEKAKGLILGFYVKRGHSDKVISIYQELLAVYRRILGPSHETTISILYELATRCRTHARSHPYWVEYYQQIVTVLNGNSKTCHPRAFEAAIIVAESYWEERRYSDAVATYTVIWNTYVHKHKEFKSFSEATFVRNLYERYYQCLEETKADYEVLRTVSKEYRETTRTTFGASSAISIEATVALAKVLQHSESHFNESMSLYEEASQSLSKSSEKSLVTIDTSEMQQTLTTMYKRRILHATDSKSVSSETLSKAVDIYHSQYESNKKSLSYSHESTLSSLRELCLIYSKQSKTEQIHKELTTAVVEIVTKETSSQKAFESATSIVQTYQACSMVQHCTQLVEELHYQLITREKSSKATFSVTESSSSALVFLAVISYHIRKDLSITLSEIMASIKAESIMWHQFTLLVSKKAGLDRILTAAAPLRFLLRTNNRTILVSVIEQKAVQAFVQGEAADVQLLAKDSPHVFVVGILDYLANRRTVDFVRSLTIASNGTLAKLIEKNDFTHAYDVAKLSFFYAQHRKGYRHPKSIARGFALASYLDGRGENRCPDPELRKKMLQLSNTIIKDILKLCKEHHINLVQVQLSELNELIALLGEQQDYDTLEALLNELWSTRDVQRGYAPEVLLNLGRRLICARYLAGRQIKALRLAEDIAYNLRRVNGIHSQSTIDAYELLASLYTRTGQYYQAEAGSDKSAAIHATEQFKKAVVIHEDVLRWLLHDGVTSGADDEDDEDTASTILAQHGKEQPHSSMSVAKRGELAKHHLHLLKMAFQRLGAWPKSYGHYESLNNALFKTFSEQLKGAEGVEKWNAKGFGSGKAETNEGVFTGSKTWEILVR